MFQICSEMKRLNVNNLLIFVKIYSQCISITGSLKNSNQCVVHIMIAVLVKNSAFFILGKGQQIFSVELHSCLSASKSRR